jgi:allantoate deiminase
VMLLGAEITRRADELAAISEEAGLLTRTLLLEQLRLAGTKVIAGMHAARMTVDFDSVGSVVGRYEGCSPGSTALLPDAHLDTVRDADRATLPLAPAAES